MTASARRAYMPHEEWRLQAGNVTALGRELPSQPSELNPAETIDGGERLLKCEAPPDALAEASQPF